MSTKDTKAHEKQSAPYCARSTGMILPVFLSRFSSFVPFVCFVDRIVPRYFTSQIASTISFTTLIGAASALIFLTFAGP